MATVVTKPVPGTALDVTNNNVAIQKGGTELARFAYKPGEYDLRIPSQGEILALSEVNATGTVVTPFVSGKVSKVLTAYYFNKGTGAVSCTVDIELI